MARSPRKPRGVRLEETKNKADNKLAFQITGIVVGLLILLFVLIHFSKSGEPEGDRISPAEERRRRIEAENRAAIEVMQKPREESEVPIHLSRQVVIALGNEDAGALESLIYWDKLFAQLAKTNNWDEERRYDKLDEKGREKLRASYLIQILDPDYASIIKDYLLEELLENAAPPRNVDVAADWGNVSWRAIDERNKPRLDIIVKCELLPGRDPVADAQNKEAWKVVGIVHEKYGKFKGGRNMSRRELGADLGKNPKAVRKKRGPLGPPESDPHEVAWVPGTSADMQTHVPSLIQKMEDIDDIRAADGARDDLIALGKTAIPGILNSMIALDHEENDADIAKAWLRIQVLREITDKRFGYGPTSSRQGFGMGGMTRATPEERVRAIRRWFGWWDKNGAAWTGPESNVEDETWEDVLGEDEDGDGGD